ncbi:small vasohibin-binding protein isoform X1 [Sphaerodactylus townsendi]|uniref:small vasohibin-binding protein isoform X1 n=1 Tax=Sphaerodactylus townsendi TaxID=933632 RepID=UPI0020269A8A|nr:small vasohibin-binding protein isoform X1 [Sphaerodactylus townsendi]
MASKAAGLQLVRQEPARSAGRETPHGAAQLQPHPQSDAGPTPRTVPIAANWQGGNRPPRPRQARHCDAGSRAWLSRSPCLFGFNQPIEARLEPAGAPAHAPLEAQPSRSPAAILLPGSGHREAGGWSPVGPVARSRRRRPRPRPGSRPAAAGRRPSSARPSRSSSSGSAPRWAGPRRGVGGAKAQIYALNRVMTELEQQQFDAFCKQMQASGE